MQAALPRVYEQYCQRAALGISHEPPEERPSYHKARGKTFADAEARIREGRRLLGEPDDLVF